MIYMTEFTTSPDGEHRYATGPSIDSGFESLDQVVEVMGSEYLTRGPRQVIYPGMVFDDHGLYGVK